MLNGLKAYTGIEKSLKLIQATIPGSVSFNPCCRVYCIAKPPNTFPEMLHPNSDQVKKKSVSEAFVAILYCDCDDK